MKVRHFITTCGVLIGAALITGITAKGASATLTYEKSSDVQFTFEPMLDLDLSETSGASDPCGLTTSPAYCITGLAPGNIGVSNVVNAKVTSNNVAGWTLYATVGGASKEPSGPTYADQKLVLIGATGDDFDMIGSSATTLSAGEWGYTLDGGTTYMDLPYYTTTTPKIINATVDSAGNPATGYAGDTTNDGTDTQIGAYADASQISGTYGNVINFTATANIPSHQVTVVAGSGVDTVSLNGSTTTLTGTFAEGDSTVAIAATCTTGNNFAGWNVTPQFGVLADRDAASTTFTVGANDVTITATCGDIFMQGFSASGMNVGDTITLKDARDNQTYTVAKLADGNVWMIDNLRLGYNSSNPATTTLTLNPADSNVTQTRTITAYDFVTYGSDKCVYTSSDTPDTGWYNACMRSRSTEATTPADGVWYNYAAATAGTITGYSNDTDATESICPKGWTLPTYAQIDNLVTLIGSSPSTFSPVYGGNYGDGTLYDESEYGGWLASTAGGTSYRYGLYYYGSELNWDYGDRTYGDYVRCVATL